MLWRSGQPPGRTAGPALVGSQSGQSLDWWPSGSGEQGQGLRAAYRKECLRATGHQHRQACPAAAVRRRGRAGHSNRDLVAPRM